MASSAGSCGPLHRLYIDVRPLVAKNQEDRDYLPLLSTLRHEQQTSITAFRRPADRLMSLASALLKYIFIHQQAKVPWNKIQISKTPDPHKRPYWKPVPGWTGEGGLEFNVSHQNGIVAFVGCQTSKLQDFQTPLLGGVSKERSVQAVPHQVRVGVDVACTNEHGRTPADITTQAKLDEWVDIFGEMFSESCRKDMKQASIPHTSSETEVIQQRFRRFYAYWALQEAFIKMVGEGLLAKWLTELDFDNVRAPTPATNDDYPDDGFSWALRDPEEIKWTPPEQAIKDITANLYGQRVTGVRLELFAYEQDFLLATSVKGIDEPDVANPNRRWIQLDIEKDIRRCAEGQCNCLD